MLEQADRLAAEDALRAVPRRRDLGRAASAMEWPARCHRPRLRQPVRRDRAGRRLGGERGRPSRRARRAGGQPRSASAVGIDLLGQLRRFGARQASDARTMPLRHVIERVVPILGTLTREVASVDVALELGDGDLAALPPDRIEQLILNLILNAATPSRATANRDRRAPRRHRSGDRGVRRRRRHDVRRAGPHLGAVLHHQGHRDRAGVVDGAHDRRRVGWHDRGDQRAGARHLFQVRLPQRERRRDPRGPRAG